MCGCVCVQWGVVKVKVNMLFGILRTKSRYSFFFKMKQSVCLILCVCTSVCLVAPSSSLHCSDIFFPLTGVCQGPRNSSAHIATLTSFLFTHTTPTFLSSLTSTSPPLQLLSFIVVSFPSTSFSPPSLPFECEPFLKKINN